MILINIEQRDLNDIEYILPKIIKTLTKVDRLEELDKKDEMLLSFVPKVDKKFLEEYTCLMKIKSLKKYDCTDRSVCRTINSYLKYAHHYRHYCNILRKGE